MCTWGIVCGPKSYAYISYVDSAYSYNPDFPRLQCSGVGQFTVYGSSVTFCHGILCNMQKPQCY